MNQASKKGKKKKGTGKGNADDNSGPAEGVQEIASKAGHEVATQGGDAPALPPEAMNKILGSFMGQLTGALGGGGMGGLADAAGVENATKDMSNQLMKAFEGDFMNKFNELFATFQEAPVNLEVFDESIQNVNTQLAEIEKLLDNIQHDRYDLVPEPTPPPPSVEPAGAENAPPESKEESKTKKAANKKKATEKEA